jgi:hypothetical protein
VGRTRGPTVRSSAGKPLGRPPLRTDRGRAGSSLVSGLTGNDELDDRAAKSSITHVSQSGGGSIVLPAGVGIMSNPCRPDPCLVFPVRRPHGVRRQYATELIRDLVREADGTRANRGRRYADNGAKVHSAISGPAARSVRKRNFGVSRRSVGVDSADRQEVRHGK